MVEQNIRLSRVLEQTWRTQQGCDTWECTSFLDKVCPHDTELAVRANTLINRKVSHLTPVCLMPKSLVRLMHDCDAVLESPQATSFSYPLVDFTQSSWDFYCDSRPGLSQKFIDGVNQITMHDIMQHSSKAEGFSIVHIRGNVNEPTHPIYIRIYCGPVDPYTSVLLLPFSHQQSWSKIWTLVRCNRNKNDCGKLQLFGLECELLFKGLARISCPASNCINKRSNTKFSSNSRTPLGYLLLDNPFHLRLPLIMYHGDWEKISVSKS